MIVGHAVSLYFDHLWGRDVSRRCYLDYEKTLYKFVGSFPETELSEFEPPLGAERIEQWIAAGWGHTTAGTRLKIMAALAGFFEWAVKRDRMTRDPMLLIERPRRRNKPRRAHSIARVKSIVAAQPTRRDQVALVLLGQLGLRKNELRTLRIRDFDLERPGGAVYLNQKGGDIVDHPILFDDVLARIREHIDVDGRRPDEFLLHPRWERSVGGERVVQREDRNRPLSTRGMHDWWVRCLERAGVEHFPLHEMRHTAGTEFHRTVHDLELTRRFMRHRSVMTTSSVYMHLDHQDMADAMARVEERWAQTA